MIKIAHKIKDQIMNRNGAFWGFVVCVVVILGLMSKADGADLQGVPVLQDSLRIWVAKRDSLRQEQLATQLVADNLARKIDTLKQFHEGGTATGPLAEALRKSLALTLALETLYGQDVIVAQVIRRIVSTLRESYDLEIDRLIAQLGTTTDTTLVGKLQAFRRTRQLLNLQVENKSLPTVTIGADDTPDDIRLKAEFMADVAGQVQQERADVDKALGRLLEERRLRSRAATFTNEFGLFDEASPQGRSVSAPTVAESESKVGEGVPPPEFDFAGIAGPAVDAGSEATALLPEEIVSGVLDLGREVTLDGLGEMGSDSGDGLEVEIRKLRLRQAALVAQEQKAQDRAERLTRYLEQLLEGQNP